MKEYHVWDAKFSDLCKNFVAPPTKARESKQALRRSMQTEDGAYGAYFRSLITETTNMTGDITPSYSILGASEFKVIRSAIEDAGFEVKVIFLMRDPVDRLWSSSRMRRRNQERLGIKIDETQLIREFEEFAKSPEQIKRTRYDKTITALEHVFDGTELHYELYENLFNHQSLGKIAGFLDRDIVDVDFWKRVNASAPLDLPSEFKAMLHEHYAEVYDFCGKRFPLTKSLWKVA